MDKGGIAMQTSVKIKIDDLLKQYPFLITLSPKFKNPTHPVSRKTIGKLATLEEAADSLWNSGSFYF